MTLSAMPVSGVFIEKCQWANVEIFDMKYDLADSAFTEPGNQTD